MYETSYEFAVNAKSASTGEWRGWSEPTTIATLSAAADEASEAAVDPACDGGVTLNAMSGIISKSLARAVVSSTCLWRLSPSGTAANAASTAGGGNATSSGGGQMLYVSFEPSVDAAQQVSASSVFSVGQTLFSPMRSQDVEVRVGVGVNNIRVIEGGSCTDGTGSNPDDFHGQLPLTFTPNTLGLAGYVGISSGVVVDATITNRGSDGITVDTIITATVAEHPNAPGSSCTNVELEVIVAGLESPHINEPGSGYTSTPDVTLVGGEGATGFVPAQVYAIAMDANQPNNFEMRFRTTCQSRKGSGATNDQCQCYEATGSRYSSVPEVQFSGGVSDYLAFSGLGATASQVANESTTPRAGTVEANQLQLLPYLAAMLPIPAAVTMHHSGAHDAHFRLRYQVVDIPAPGPVGNLASSASSATSLTLSWERAVGVCRNSSLSRPATLDDVQRSIGPDGNHSFSRQSIYQEWWDYANRFAQNAASTHGDSGMGGSGGGTGGMYDPNSGMGDQGGGGDSGGAPTLTPAQMTAATNAYNNAISYGADMGAAQANAMAVVTALMSGKSMEEAVQDGMNAAMSYTGPPEGINGGSLPFPTQSSGSNIRRQLKHRAGGIGHEWPPPPAAGTRWSVQACARVR